MKAEEIKKLNAEELVQKLVEIQQELFKLRIQGATGNLENSARIRLLRRTFARIKTEQTARSAKQGA
jgi:large subunit ribosomal protein L29